MEIDQKTLKKYALEFLRKNETTALSTVDLNNKPHVATVYYIVEDDFTFYIISSADSKKVQNIGDNSNVALVVGFGPSPVTIQTGGTAEILSNYEYLEIMKKIGYENIHKWPVFFIGKGEFVVVKIKPEWMVFLNLDKEGDPERYYKSFHKII
jgi:general stress protein 26